MKAAKGDAAYLQDMVDAGEAVLRYMAGKSRVQYGADPMLRDAVERRIEIMGEAARGVTLEFCASHPEIPWNKIKATRHILAHDYGEVDEDIVWRIATEHLPRDLPLLRKLIPPIPPLEDIEPEHKEPS